MHLQSSAPLTAHSSGSSPVLWLEADVWRGGAWRPAWVPRGVTFTAARAALGGGGELTLVYRQAPPGTGRKDQMRL